MKQKTLEAIKSNIETDGLIKTSELFGLSVNKLIELCDLHYKTFEDINFMPHYGGVAGKIMFKNGYGASVIRHEHSYGGKKGLYELAVLDNEGNLTYDTPVTNDVLGFLSPKEVTDYLIQIQDLKN
jgi:hypothetical protein